jgi:hypothetical protein
VLDFIRFDEFIVFNGGVDLKHFVYFLGADAFVFDVIFRGWSIVEDEL